MVSHLSDGARECHKSSRITCHWGHVWAQLLERGHGSAVETRCPCSRKIHERGIKASNERDKRAQMLLIGR